MLTPLPIDEVIPQVLDCLQQHSSLVLQAPPGAGKTTRLPPALLASGLAGEGRIVMLEPRRVAARAAARRIAEESGWSLGQEVGYQVRNERRASKGTRILVVTEGILVAMLQQDPFLEGVNAVLFDEVHERGLTMDLALAMTKRVQTEVRPELRLVALSATLEADRLAQWLGGCPVLRSSGRTFPVTVRYLEREDPRPIIPQVIRAVQRALNESPGDVLVFLPGVGEIKRAQRGLEELAAEQDLSLMTLYGDLASSEQDAVLRPGLRRKVVLATNVAETSVTIDGVSAVVDSGLVRSLRFDPARGLDRLELGRISRASAEQRAGRAGRQQQGLCLRLWTEHQDRSLAAREIPEVLRLDLAGPVLQLLAWGENDLHDFDWLEAPEQASIDRALALLSELGALERRGNPPSSVRITDLGRRMASLPLHPRLSRLTLAARSRGATRRGALASALLSERDIFHRPGLGGREGTPEPTARGASSPSDILDRVEALEHLAATGADLGLSAPLHRERARFVLRSAAAIERSLRRMGGTKEPEIRLSEERDKALLRALLSAFPDRLACRRSEDPERGLMVGGRGVRLAAQSAVREGELFLAIDANAGRGGERREAWVRMASMVRRDWLSDEATAWHQVTLYDPEQDRVLGRRELRYRDLVLEQRQHDPGPEAASAALARAAEQDLQQAIPIDDPAWSSFLARCRWLAAEMPELGLARWQEPELKALLPVLTAGRRSFDQLRRAPWLDTLRGMMDPAQLNLLERLAPERLAVPSGSQLRLDYSPGRPPVLAVRIQELFGLAEHPTVADGKVTVLLHLLAPNGRPQQVTRDLRSFWANTYAQVRKELHGRYPKHSWPTDPLRAEAERRPRPKRKKATR